MNTPKYQMAKDVIANQIQSGEYRPGDKLPSERALCDQFNISRVTASKVYTQLERAGFVCSAHKSGWYVADIRLEYQLTRSASFITNIEQMGASPAIQVHDSGMREPTQLVSEALEISKNVNVAFVQRLFTVAGRPAMVEDLFVEESQFSDILNAQLDQSILALWETEYKVSIKSFDAKIRCINLQDPYTKLLATDANSVGLNLTQIFHLDDKKPIGVSQQYWRADVAEFAFSINYS